jgi:hypothetical protein
VNAYCPRAFSSISKPDHVLGTRAIPHPLVKTADSTRGNADPADFACWPCDQRELQDDLWALALSLLPEAARVWRELDAETSMVGRDFERWRAILAAARLLDRHGTRRLEVLVRAAMKREAADRPRSLGTDWATTILRALVRRSTDLLDRAEAVRRAADGSDGLDGSDGSPVRLAASFFTQQRLFLNREIVATIGADDEEEAEDSDQASPWNQRVG